MPKAILLDQDLHKRVAKNLLDPLFRTLQLQSSHRICHLNCGPTSSPSVCLERPLLVLHGQFCWSRTPHDCSGSNSNPQRVASTSSISVVLDLLQMLPQSWQFSAHHRLGVECRCFRSIPREAKDLICKIGSCAARSGVKWLCFDEHVYWRLSASFAYVCVWGPLCHALPWGLPCCANKTVAKGASLRTVPNTNPTTTNPFTCVWTRLCRLGPQVVCHNVHCIGLHAPTWPNPPSKDNTQQAH